MGEKGGGEGKESVSCRCVTACLTRAGQCAPAREGRVEMPGHGAVWGIQAGPSRTCPQVVGVGVPGCEGLSTHTTHFQAGQHKAYLSAARTSACCSWVEKSSRHLAPIFSSACTQLEMLLPGNGSGLGLTLPPCVAARATLLVGAASVVGAGAAEGLGNLARVSAASVAASAATRVTSAARTCGRR